MATGADRTQLQRLRVARVGIITMLSMLASIVGEPAGAQVSSYEGKQIRLVIASGAGGGYDVYARFLARHLPRHIPGNPTIVTQNMPAASGLAATNWAYMKDQAFLAEAEKSLFDVDPLNGEEMEQILRRAYATPKALVQRAAEFNGSGGS